MVSAVGRQPRRGGGGSVYTSIPMKGARRTPEGLREPCEDALVREFFLSLVVNDALVAELSCTPDHLKALVVGRLCTEGIIEEAGQVADIRFCQLDGLAEVTLAEGVELTPTRPREPTCCTGNRQYLGGSRSDRLRALPEVEVDPAAVFALAARFRADSTLHRTTNGTHSCYLRQPDGEIVGFEDISRHNALDKAVGHMLLSGFSPERCMLYTTGRVPADMVQKAVMARVPVLASKSVPTDAGVNLAAKYGLRLLCRAWPDSFVCYQGEG